VKCEEWSELTKNQEPRTKNFSLSRSPKHFAWFLLALLTAASGASCPQFLSNYPSVGPRVLQPTATLADVMRVVNDNSNKVRSIVAPDASLSVPMTPALRANVTLERPRRFRLRAETSLTGQELDLGSNDSLFWFWVKRMQPSAVYYCRHEQYNTSAARQVIPVEPEWLIDAIGLPTLDPNGQHTGPYMLRGDRLEVRTQLNTANGPMTKITIVDSRGLVVEQHLYDGRGQLVASATASQHFHDPASGANLPRLVEIQAPATKFSLKISFHTLQVNQTGGDIARYFELPSYPGVPLVDLGDPNFHPPGVAPASYPSQQLPNQPLAPIPNAASTPAVPGQIPQGRRPGSLGY
jgi:hypothetical protein